MSEALQARVGVGVLILKDGKLLLGKRKGSHGAGLYGLPGGHLEYGETLQECGLREIAEECGVKVKNMRFLCVSDFMTHFPKHYVDVGFVAEWESGEPQVLEPHKVEGWDWYDLDDLPSPVFGPSLSYVEAYKTGKQHFIHLAPEAA